MLSEEAYACRVSGRLDAADGLERLWRRANRQRHLAHPVLTRLEEAEHPLHLRELRLAPFAMRDDGGEAAQVLVHARLLCN